MDSDEAQKAKPSEQLFKKPMLVGKIGKLPKKLFTAKNLPIETQPLEESNVLVEAETPVQNVPTELKSVPYEEPPWSSLPENSSNYILEVLKNGSIIETINLRDKKFWVFGRLANCDICMQHPTISRYHAVLQYKHDINNSENTGFYIYDLESTHGTFLNKNRIRPRSFVRTRVGHMLKLGCSTRSYILNGPPEDAEEESPLTITELKQQRAEKINEKRREEEEKLRKIQQQEESGIDWGMGEDADEEADLSENPFAQTNNEELYLDNPKKALRGFFEREGLELEYDCTEQGIGQFLCKVELPVDDEMGRPIFAEVIHKGKKKEAVVQCALEACRILDRHGLLRQATHESKKRKPKNWEENDYYDSDDDTFLDRTGTVEKKREMRMNAKIPQKPETYESLLEKENTVNEKIKRLERELLEAQKNLSSSQDSCNSEDSLDVYMKELKHTKPNKQTINKIKSELIKLKQEHQNVIKLVNIAKPVSLPPLVAQYSTDSSEKKAVDIEKKSLPIFGKRKKIKLNLPVKKSQVQIDDNEEEGEGMEEEKIEERLQITKEEKIQEEDGKGTNQKELSSEVLERKKRNNQKRIQQKQKKAEIQKQKGYDEDAHKEDYNMWVPPTDQTGDGRTSLNDKLGY